MQMMCKLLPIPRGTNNTKQQKRRSFINAERAITKRLANQRCQFIVISKLSRYALLPLKI